MFNFLLCAMMLTTPTSLFDFTMKTIDGSERPLDKYKGKVILVVNVASFCGYTYQYELLEQLYRANKDRNFVILAFPSNDFGAQEPGTDDEIKQFCEVNFGISFPLFSKIVVKGDGKHELYRWLTSGGGNDALQGEVKWNFEKFLIDKSGKVISRYNREVEPNDPDFLSDLNKALDS